MCDNKDDLLNNIHSLIEKKKEFYEDSLNVNVVEHSDGIIIQNFTSWDEFINNTKTKEIKKVGDFSINKNVLMIFAKKGTIVPLTDFGCNKTYVFITGEIRLYFNDREDILVKGISTMECDIPHGGEVIEDTYFIVVDEY